MGVIELNSRELVKIPAALGEFDVLKSLTLMAGVNNTGDVSNGVSIRGGSLDQNYYYLIQHLYLIQLIYLVYFLFLHQT